MQTVLWFLLPLLGVSFPLQDSAIKERMSHLVTDGIVEDLTHYIPDDILLVQYKRGVHVQLGNSLGIAQVAKEPVDLSLKTREDHFYTVLMVDLDSPSREQPTLRCYRNWLVINVPSDMNTDQGTLISTYLGPRPSRTSGTHRIVFLAYSQGPQKLGPNLPVVDVSRSQFDVHAFADSYGLGDPVGINFFLIDATSVTPRPRSLFENGCASTLATTKAQTLLRIILVLLGKCYWSSTYHSVYGR